MLLMEKMKWFKISLIAFMITLFSCENDSQDIIKLPFYNSAEFTPEWIEEGTPQYNSIHIIKEFSFKNQHGKLISKNTIHDKIIVSNFFFTSCPGICPKMMDNLIKVQNAFSEDSDFAILSHSVTPWIDSVNQLKNYAIHKNIHATNWHLLTGDKKEIYDIARLSYFADEGFGKSVTIEDDFLHTENVVLVDTKGRIRGVYNGTLQVEISRLIEDIKFLKEYN